MKSATYITLSEEATIALGAQLARSWSLPVVAVLTGNLGAGKTTLVKGIAEGLGVTGRDEVSSPTFPLIHEYGQDGQLAHVDLYRLETLEEVESLGLDEIIARADVTVLEWAERFPSILPADRLEIVIQARDDDSRAIEVRELP
ncbi:MAG: tRNA (adenosine(37)-N6)-threonylcarbamoyltransferase complex ATPase subunit type 1 TsaE [Bryobacter sp.]|jgi:tRNA threonylcarbamoyladenosine biosynthesis protein TsaE|nr:tRNA (adenosine(37)-N6)-threonylcarbamoyltransferase complex ATPase subunit type 1 TsaE [Bryobacter sp.]